MGLFYHILSCILKSLDIHKSRRIHHSHLSQIIRQLAASLDKASIEVDVELHRLLIISLSKLLQFRTEVAAVSIWRVSHGDIKRRGKNIQESHGVIHQ